MERLKKTISFTLIILIFITCLSGCDISKIITKRRASKVMDALVTLNSKKIKVTGNYSDETLDVIKLLKKNPHMEVLLPRLSYEIDEENITTEDGVTYCDVDVKLPDYEDAYLRCGADVFEYAEEIKSQEESDYITIPVTLAFKDKKLINGDDVFSDMYSSLIFMFEPSSGYTGKLPIIYEDDNIKLKFLRLDSLGAHFLIKNYADYEIFVAPKDISINGRSYCDIDCYCHIKSGEVGEATCKFDIDYTQDVGTVAGHFFMGSTDFSQKSYFTLEKTVINDKVTVNAPSVDGTLIYEDKNVRLAYKETTTDHIIFDAENLTENNIRIGIDTLALNGKNIDGLSILDYQYVAPLSVGEIKFDLPYGAVSDTGIATVVGKFRMYTFDNQTQKDESSTFNVDSGILDDSIVVETGSDGFSVYEDSNVKIYYKEISSDGVVFDIENLTDYEMTLVAEAVSINKQSFALTLCGDTYASHSLGTLVAECDLDPSTPVGELSAFFRYSYKTDSGTESQRFPLDTVIIDSNVAVVPPTPEGPLVYEDKNVKIYYNGVAEKGLAFDVENLSNIPHSINSEQFFINFKEYTEEEILISGVVAPHSTGTLVLVLEVPEDDIKVISGTLHIVDNTNFSSYNAEITETKFE